MILGMNLLTFAVLLVFIGMGVTDLYLVFKQKDTISQKVQAWTQNKWLDAAIMIGILVLAWWIFTPAAFVPCLGGCILGHLFWCEED